jgi:hypothetical protein
MQPIHVSRYKSPNTFAGYIEPEDRSWIVFVDAKGLATFWRRTEVQMKDEDGIHHEHGYIDVEIPGGIAEGEVPVLSAPEPAQYPGPIDYKSYFMEAQPPFPAAADGSYPASNGIEAHWCAELNCRDIVCIGETEHAAIQNLMNYVAQLCTAGCMDHTGLPVPGVSPRRHAAVWGPPEPQPNQSTPG